MQLPSAPRTFDGRTPPEPAGKLTVILDPQTPWVLRGGRFAGQKGRVHLFHYIGCDFLRWPDNAELLLPVC
jgi:hypothetical protein